MRYVLCYHGNKRIVLGMHYEHLCKTLQAFISRYHDALLAHFRYYLYAGPSAANISVTYRTIQVFFILPSYASILARVKKISP